ncbi:MAG TPA: IclR family transcriptional regulator [Burkholderiaceae bacterium]|nr:IclR family transcriptional regulator [Burkholderiaceae bacterium]
MRPERALEGSADGGTEGARSIRRAILVLRLLAAGQERGVRLIDLVAGSGLPRPTVHRILRVLLEEGAVEQDRATRRYMIGPEASLLGLARKALFPIRSIADPALEHLRRQVGDTVFLTIRSGLDSVCVDRRVGSYPLQVLALEIGARRPLGIGVSGVAMLSSLPEAAAAAVVESNAARFATHGLAPAQLHEQVRLARQRGHAYSAQGIIKGTRAVAVAVVDGAQLPVAAISIAAVADRLSPARLAPTVALLREQADAVSRRLIERARRRS